MVRTCPWLTGRISVIGSGIRAAQCALTLAEMGIDVSLITPSPSLDLDNVRPSRRTFS